MECIAFSPIIQPQLDVFFQKAFEANGFKYEPNTTHKDLQHIEIVFIKQGGGFWVLKQNDLIIGTAGLKIIDGKEKTGELKCMYVLPEYQSKGLGQKLVDKIINESRQRQLKRIRLDVKPGANSAIYLYRKNGFYDIPRYNENKNNVIFMEKIV